MRNIITMDLDTTICDTRHRWPMIDREKGTDWDAYSLACVNDDAGPALPMAQFFTEENTAWFVVSGRSEIAREATRKWLWDRDVRPWGIYLCDDRHNYMKHGEWKATRLVEIEKELDVKIKCHYDDITEVAVATEKVGIKTLLVHDVHSGFLDHLG